MDIAAPIAEPTARRRGIAVAAVVRAADIVALALLLYLVLRLWFDRDVFFDSLGAIVGVAGLSAAAVAGARLGTFLDWPLLAYASLTVLSVAAGQQGFAAASSALPGWRPAVHSVVLVAYFYAATWILRTRWRVAVVMTILVAAVGLVGVQAAYDHVYVGLDTRLIGYTSTAPWMGYPDLALLFALALPVPLALLTVARAKRVVCAAMLIAAMFWLDQVLLYSRSGYLSALAAFLTVAAVEIVALKRTRLIRVLIPFAVVVVVVAATSARLDRTLRELGGSYVYDSRFAIWQRTLAMIADHPWLGVGPGNYVAAMRSVYEWRTWDHADDLHAHNMLLHVAAESGIPAAFAFFLIWLKLFRRLWLAATAPGPARAVTIGVFGALVAFFVRCLTDHFMSGFVISDRVAFLLWTLMAAGVAATRLSAGTVAAQPLDGVTARG